VIAQQSRKAQPSRDLCDAGQARQLRPDRLEILDPELFGRARAFREKSRPGHLQVAGLRMDDRLSQLMVQIAHEPARDDQRRHAEGDGRDRDRAASTVPKHVARGEQD
jgi:hypothetical protein